MSRSIYSTSQQANDKTYPYKYPFIYITIPYLPTLVSSPPTVLFDLYSFKPIKRSVHIADIDISYTWYPPCPVRCTAVILLTCVCFILFCSVLFYSVRGPTCPINCIQNNLSPQGNVEWYRAVKQKKINQSCLLACCTRLFAYHVLRSAYLSSNSRSKSRFVPISLCSFPGPHNEWAFGIVGCGLGLARTSFRQAVVGTGFRWPRYLCRACLLVLMYAAAMRATKRLGRYQWGRQRPCSLTKGVPYRHHIEGSIKEKTEAAESANYYKRWHLIFLFVP